MPDYLLLMHDDTPHSGHDESADDWAPYIGRLQSSGNFQGGSVIGEGVCARKSGEAPAITGHLGGFIRVSADSLDHARTLLIGNPVFEAGGTVEIRELPRTD
jgi:YCII-related domain